MRKIATVLISCITVFALTGCSGNEGATPPDQERSTSAVNSETVEAINQTPDNAIKEGIYRVGADIQAGDYALTAQNNSGYYCVSSDNMGKDILANDNFVNKAYITIEEGQFLKLSNCFMIPEAEQEALNIEGEINEGIYRVGKDIPVGDYALKAQGDSGYYCISSDNLGKDILANDNFKDSAYITIEEGQFLKLSDCTMFNEAKKETAIIDEGEIGEGIYRVGKDISAGDYSLKATGDSGYYCISSDNLGKNILANDNFKNNAYITIEEGQFLKLSDCIMSSEKN